MPPPSRGAFGPCMFCLPPWGNPHAWLESRAPHRQVRVLASLAFHRGISSLPAGWSAKRTASACCQLTVIWAAIWAASMKKAAPPGAARSSDGGSDQGLGRRSQSQGHGSRQRSAAQDTRPRGGRIDPLFQFGAVAALYSASIRAISGVGASRGGFTKRRWITFTTARVFGTLAWVMISAPTRRQS
jgi:hypothetical protein